ncbi:MAG: DUF2225 domain-containing protein [Armatimonadetes bacterium]|nr:DUF2225 domain-containing protein [Armatimonadota bacterium]
MTTIMPETLTCPVCGTVFEAWCVGSCSTCGKDTDFRPHYLGMDPLSVFVQACPRCHFAGYPGDFESVPAEVKRFVLSGGLRAEEVVGQEPPDELRGSTKYILAARCLAADPDTEDLEVADLYLRASWCARMERFPERERECQAEAVARFEQALETGRVESEQRAVILYLVGELYRRLGMFDVARQFFDEALHASPDEHEPGLMALIQRQDEAARARRSENMQM